MTKRETFHKSGLGHFKKAGTVAEKVVQDFATEQKLEILLMFLFFLKENL
jgi:hypothetical protein